MAKGNKNKQTAAEQAIRAFDFWDYGLNEVDPESEYAEWVAPLAAAVVAAIEGTAS
ncbi:hypothetical protein GCM10010193_70700 [Kitasatospora atroaurantiaca]|uniref:Uncharacterized protein n=1 Tax=Kitasatospora atroaurantiaca TaxID=285545 RepID=A0A561ENG7_9ACTN|nr:hypothetical protein [Kitasatospora atroaurantiaca]TWE17156.1 hypothetical protein FB465_2161 [Kitasatospora atroaurantiaca]